MQTMRRIDVQINGKLVGSCDSISKVSSPLFKDILDPWIDIKGFVPEKPFLNKNQQIVLEWLKDNVLQDGTSAMCSVFQFGTLWEMRRFNDQEAIRVDNAYCELNNDEQFQVLQAFAEWGKEKVMK